MGKSQEEIAFEMLSKLKGLGVWGEGNKDEILDLYAECLIASKGLRRVKGLESSQPAPALQPGFKPQPPVAAAPQPAPYQTAAYQPVQQHGQPPLHQQAPQNPVQNPVHQQQQQLAQNLAPPAPLQRQG